MAMGWVCVIEGAAYALFPTQLRRLAALVQHLPEDTLRLAGLFVVSLGVASLWLMNH